MTRQRVSIPNGLRAWISERREIPAERIDPERVRAFADAALADPAGLADIDIATLNSDVVEALVASVRRRRHRKSDRTLAVLEATYQLLNRIPARICSPPEILERLGLIAIRGWWMAVHLAEPEAEKKWFARLPPTRPSPFCGKLLLDRADIVPASGSPMKAFDYTDDGCFALAGTLFRELKLLDANVIGRARRAYRLVAAHAPNPDLDAVVAGAQFATVIGLAYTLAGSDRLAAIWTRRAVSGYLERADSVADLAFLEFKGAQYGLGSGAVGDSLKAQVFRRVDRAELPVFLNERDRPTARAVAQGADSLNALIQEMLRGTQRDPSRGVEVAMAAYRNPSSSPWFKGNEHRYLGEMALVVGVAFRTLFRRELARNWLDRAEEHFSFLGEARVCRARLQYQRLALCLEERQVDVLRMQLPVLVQELEALSLDEESLKALFLEASLLRETGDIERAINVCLRICETSKRINNLPLLSMAFGNLAQFYRVQGDLARAMLFAKRALPLLESLQERVGLAKLRWCVGDILRAQGENAAALESYRSALHLAEEIGTRNDAVAIHLVIAELLLDAGQDRQAEWEIRAALPIIDEERMVPEGLAALGLLRESVRRRKIDRTALREIHEYFPQE